MSEKFPTIKINNSTGEMIYDGQHRFDLEELEGRFELILINDNETNGTHDEL
jgi:hypothetical protein